MRRTALSAIVCTLAILASPAVPAAQPYTLERQFDTPDLVESLTIGPAGNIYALPYSRLLPLNVWKLAPSGALIGGWDTQGTVAIAVDAAERVWAITSDNGVESFDSNGTYLGPWPEFDAWGETFRSLVVADDMVYLLSEWGVDKYTAAGERTGWGWGGRGFSDIALDNLGHAYVMSQSELSGVSKHRLNDGAFLWRSCTPTVGGLGPAYAASAMAVDGAGNVFLAYHTAPWFAGVSWEKYDPSGRLLTRWTSNQTADVTSLALAVGSDGDVYAVINSTVYVYSQASTTPIARATFGSVKARWGR